MRHALVAFVLVGGLGAAASGCYSRATAYEGKFTLAYASGLTVENFVKPIAPGAKLDVVVFTNDGTKNLAISKARSSKPTVLAVESASDGKIVLKGVEPGIAELEVTVTDGEGKSLVDKMFFHVAKPAKHGLEHACTEEPEAAYVKGEDIDIMHSMVTSDGRTVIGYAYAPVKVEPSNALELVAQPQGWGFYRYRATAAKPKVTLRSQVDDKSISMRIVDRSELKDAVLHNSTHLLEGGSSYAVAHVRYGALELCNQNALTKAKSLTPETCTVTANLDGEPDKDSNREQIITVNALKFGVCKYQMILPELAGGKGVVLEGSAKVGRLQFPGEQGAGAPAPQWRVFGYERDAWFRAGWWLLASRVAALAFVIGWLRGRATAASSSSNSSA